ncbi:nicotinate-nucleotide--dimethylbenzimidazole phosphoribosyltransferase [Bryobacter aggregatus]|uniref:nicotinate-nucleotide--dimethylbenzimidazole phosphoribosyltransferase n=1 Tax=Bryobacter aggregatus TaxID=360054 RepID=UPI00056638C2|nr:nicotinate-nucleotide--dimethylbenzimidazole phosphoribosyltransferase [Bryobacter aggregatus]
MKAALQNEIAARWDSRTKPQGSLGRLEDLARDYCLIRGEALPACERLGLYLFAADHGVTEEGISLYPKEVTRQMVANFMAGGAAVNVLARAHGVVVEVVDAGVGTGTANFARQAAMSAAACESHLEAGRQKATEAAAKFDLVGIGEMGIGNTTSAAAILAAFEGLPGIEVAGAGTGLSDEGIVHKAAVIDRALALHQLQGATAQSILASVGGFEIVQMTGFLLEAARLRLPVVIDGFITSAAALAAIRLAPETRQALIFSHCSAERGHIRMLQALQAEALFDLGMRLGEGSGAILGMHLVRSAMALYRDMASFESAQVSTQSKEQIEKTLRNY